MNKTIIIMPIMCMFMGLLALISRQQHILPMLLCLESLMLLMINYLLLSQVNKSMFMGPYIIILLSMSVSSASMGLTLLVMASRKMGNDSLSSQMTYMC
uniref:NADH-ubiquinone oxidoreductase chain 4L n=1 Tax=Olavius algarvensis TaxID=188229 RepID=A0A7R9NHB3_9ANNE|nr:ND4L CDS [Olavius algarvensis]CAD7857589.1 ND4L CDS [Olavius algarvensis]